MTNIMAHHIQPEEWEVARHMCIISKFILMSCIQKQQKKDLKGIEKF